ncbi:uncharacterized protein LOC122504505 [Leptopilina heterotoma]|uniref:uncharacterized protein LOC122504505 n=1 Tax=Leptopilina heterotoma TaxID=63436 RepID=UPI001CAA3B6B|nr:uncharacterized protein LOC122504505 [Leptopilina heterotoma]XP_043471586.1 uncharacterized protein LOC122504505 [Leptopilina heterotoma]
MREREKNRRRHSKGEEYTTAKGKKIHALKKPSVKLTCRCKWNCSVLSHKQRTLLFNQYRSLDRNSQRSYLSNLIDVVNSQRSRTSGPSRRQVTTLYRLRDEEGTAVSVCKSTFQDTFGLGRGELDVLREKTKLGKDITKDKRGGRYNVKYTTSDRDLIVDFIKLFPRDTSHYGRKDSNKEYLSSDLSYQKLFDEFTQKNSEKEISLEYFVRIFKENFPNLSFHSPRVDTCNTCDKTAIRELSLPQLSKEKKADIRKILDMLPADKKAFFEKLL